MSKPNFKKMYLISEARLNALNAATSLPNSQANGNLNVGLKETDESKNTNQPEHPGFSKEPKINSTHNFNNTEPPPCVPNTDLSNKSNKVFQKGIETKPPFIKIYTRKYQLKNNAISQKKKHSQ